MTHMLFCLLSPDVQLLYTLTRGTYLASRQEQESEVMLHYVPDEGRGFFIEVGTDEAQTQFFVLRSFRDSGPLAVYAQLVWLPGD